MDVPMSAARVMRAYGNGDWLEVIHTGWDGGLDDFGRRKDSFRRMLHECGYHFVLAGHTYYIRVPEGLAVDLMTRNLKEMAGSLRRPGKVDTRNNRSRVKVRFPLVSFD
jgi:hypothetical protein